MLGSVLGRTNFQDPGLRVARVGVDLLCISVDAPRGESASLQERLARLTPSECSVVLLAARGFSNPRIAELRDASAKTIANQLNAAYSKLGVSGRRELRALFTTAQRGL
jgi:DNA-binding NarL/FixJ family response regulator